MEETDFDRVGYHDHFRGHVIEENVAYAGGRWVAEAGREVEVEVMDFLVVGGVGTCLREEFFGDYKGEGNGVSLTCFEESVFGERFGVNWLDEAEKDMESFGSAIGGRSCGYLLDKGLGGPFKCHVNLVKRGVISGRDGDDSSDVSPRGV